jgi:hypothetical protein
MVEETPENLPELCRLNVPSTWQTYGITRLETTHSSPKAPGRVATSR